MKKKIFIFFLVFAGVILSLFSFKNDLYTELIVNTHNNADFTDIYIIYSNINYSKIKSYTLTSSKPKVSNKTFVPYSEGFIPNAAYRQYKKAFLQNNEDFSMMFQDYYESEDLVYFAFPGDLSSFRVLNRTTDEIKQLIIDESTHLSPMYVSHMQQVGDQLIILAGQAHAYNALIYTVDLPTLKVTSSKQLGTHPSALDGTHFTLTSDGIALFIAGDKLQVYNPFTDEESFIPLPFTTTGVISQAHTTLVYGEQDGVLYTSVLDESFNLSPMHTTRFPSSSCKLIDLSIKGDTLFIATVDPLGLRFRNYISGYNLSTGQLTYCLGIEEASPFMLMALE
ncbi:MAG: hypothetical protein E6370_15360 [Clostridiales bacterium]|nr:hypothetical protein [Clostridiales bacterium]MDU6975679.1 hypothetical protein [Clostridiales bacterium]